MSTSSSTSCRTGRAVPADSGGLPNRVTAPELPGYPRVGVPGPSPSGLAHSGQTRRSLVVPAPCLVPLPARHGRDRRVRPDVRVPDHREPGPEEPALRLDPQSWDTDDDGFPDPDEVADAKHPKDADSDGIIDALESDLTDNDQDGTYDTTDVAAGWQVAAERLYPHAIANDGKDSTRIEVVVTGPGVTRVALQSPAQFYDPSVLPNELQIDGKPLGNAALELYDDGTHGDRFAAAASRSRVLQATRRGRLRAQPLRRRARTTLSR